MLHSYYTPLQLSVIDTQIEVDRILTRIPAQRMIPKGIGLSSCDIDAKSMTLPDAKDFLRKGFRSGLIVQAHINNSWGANGEPMGVTHYFKYAFEEQDDSASLLRWAPQHSIWITSISFTGLVELYDNVIILTPDQFFIEVQFPNTVTL